MRDSSNSVQVPKWPFFIGDAAMLGIAYFIYYQTPGRLGHWEILAGGTCVALGALVAIVPFLLDHRARIKQIDAVTLLSVTERIRNLETLTSQITNATNEWQNVQLQSEKISGSAKEITERMATEVRDFTEFMKKAGDSERATMRLEIEKLRRGEKESVQILIHLLDHVHGLHAGGVRSGQARLIEQLTQFRNICHETVRRVGLVPFAPAPGDAFDPAKHQSAERGEVPAGATVTEVAAAGFTFQGQLARPALVRVMTGVPNAAAAEAGQALPPSPADKGQQSQLTLEGAPPS